MRVRVVHLGSDSGDKAEQKRATRPKLVDMVIRVSHVVASSFLYGGIMWDVTFSQLRSWHHLTIATGCALIASGICGSRHWPYQGRGLMAWLHVCLLWLVHLRPAAQQQIATIVLITGVVGSHLPGFIRHWSLLHRRRID